MTSDFPSHVFVDGPNIDMILGQDVLGRIPRPPERPRWERVSVYCRTELGCVRPTFVLNGDRFALGGERVFAFRRALRFMGYNVECPLGTLSDPVDAFIQQQLRTIARFHRPCSVAILSHDHGYAPDLSAILMLGGSVAVIGFPEEMHPQLLQLAEQGAIIVDLERDIGAFNLKLPRPHLV